MRGKKSQKTLPSLANIILDLMPKKMHLNKCLSSKRFIQPFEINDFQMLAIKYKAGDMKKYIK